MSSGLSRLQLFNMVADHIEDAEIASVTEDKKVARAIRRWEPVVRDQLLVKMRPNFARRRTTLAAMTTAPAFGWSHQYELPANCLAVYRLQSDGAFEGQGIAYEVEQGPNGKKVIMASDAGATAYLRYIVREENTGLWDPQFCAAWAARVARQVVTKIAGKKSMLETIMAIERAAIAEAQYADQIEGTAERAEATEWDIQRRGAW